MESENVLSSVAYTVYCRNASTFVYRAMDFSDRIVLHGLRDQSVSYQITNELNAIAQDVFTRGKASRILCLYGTKNNGMTFSIFDKKRFRRYRPENIIFSGSLRVKCRDFGFKHRSVRRAVKRLKELRTNFRDKDWTAYTETQREIADKLGSFMFWTYSETTAFTDAFLLIQQCNKIITASKFCRKMEDEINSFFFASGYRDLSISIPTYSVEDYESSKKAFISGKMLFDSFSKLVFHHS